MIFLLPDFHTYKFIYIYTYKKNAGKSHFITFPDRLPMQKISVFGKILLCDGF